LDSSEAKTWQWWPLTSDSPQGPLTRKAICIEQKRGAEKNHWMCSPPSVAHTLLCGKAIGATTLDPRAPPHPKKCTTWVFSFFLSLSSSGNGTTINTKHANQEALHVLFFCPHSQEKGVPAFQRKKKQGRKKENDNLGCQKKK
jgi:hypothetical protein